MVKKSKRSNRNSPKVILNEPSQSLFSRVRLLSFDTQTQAIRQYASGCVTENGSVLLATYTGSMEYYLNLDEFIIKYQMYNNMDIQFLDSNISIENLMTGMIS